MDWWAGKTHRETYWYLGSSKSSSFTLTICHELFVCVPDHYKGSGWGCMVGCWILGGDRKEQWSTNVESKSLSTWSSVISEKREKGKSRPNFFAPFGSLIPMKAGPDWPGFVPEFQSKKVAKYSTPKERLLPSDWKTNHIIHTQFDIKRVERWYLPIPTLCACVLISKEERWALEGAVWYANWLKGRKPGAVGQ